MLEPEPPSVFDREYARVEVDSNKEIRKQEQDENKKDEFDENDGDDWDSEEWDDFDDGPIADREKKELEKEKWQIIRGRDHTESKGDKPPPKNRKRPKKKENKKALLDRLNNGDRNQNRKWKKKNRLAHELADREAEPENDRQFVRHPRNKSSSERYKRRQKADPVTESYRESFYRNDRKKKKKRKPSKVRKKKQQHRLKPKSSDRRKDRRLSKKKRRKRRKKKPKPVPVEEYEDDGEQVLRHADEIPSSKNKRKPKKYSKNYVYIKKKPPSERNDGVKDYDVAYARGNYQAFVDEYDSDRDEEPIHPQSDESAIVYRRWKG